MPIEIKDCDGGIGNLIVGRMIVTDQEYIESLTRHLTQDKEKFSKYRYSLTDLTAATKLNISNETVNIIAQLCIEASKVNPNPIVAIVANDDLIYGLSRMYQSLVDMTEWETMVFRSRNESEEWIKERVREKFGIDNLALG